MGDFVYADISSPYHLIIAAVIVGNPSLTNQDAQQSWYRIVGDDDSDVNRPDFVFGFIAGAIDTDCMFADPEWYDAYQEIYSPFGDALDSEEDDVDSEEDNSDESSNLSPEPVASSTPASLVPLETENFGKPLRSIDIDEPGSMPPANVEEEDNGVRQGETHHEPSALCPVCRNGRLTQIADGEFRGVRCVNNMCIFNFQDQLCDECGQAMQEVSQQSQGPIQLRCSNGHSWTL